VFTKFMARTEKNMIPSEFALAVNPPSQVEAGCVMFDLPVDTRMTLRIYDALGYTVHTLVDGHMAAGSHRVAVTAEFMPSGVYFYRMEAGTFIQTRKVLLLKPLVGNQHAD